MNAWMLIWQVCLLTALTGFAIFTVVVSIGGVLDILKLFRRLEESRQGGKTDD